MRVEAHQISTFLYRYNTSLLEGMSLSSMLKLASGFESLLQNSSELFKELADFTALLAATNLVFWIIIGWTILSLFHHLGFALGAGLVPQVATVLSVRSSLRYRTLSKNFRKRCTLKSMTMVPS
jgi:hypothetical protein